MSLQTDLDSLQSSLNSIDTITTNIGTAINGVQTRVTNILSQIPNAATLAEASALSVQAAAELSKLSPAVDTLNSIGLNTTTNPPVPFSAAPTSAGIFTGGTITIVPSAPATFSSDNEAVATVDSNGIVTGVSVGSTNIISTLISDTTQTATSVVTVSDIAATNARLLKQ